MRPDIQPFGRTCWFYQLSSGSHNLRTLAEISGLSYGRPVPEDETWEKSVARAVGRRVAYFRNERGLTGGEVSSALSAIGVDLKRTALSNLEVGARSTVGLAEIKALSWVLGVPPLALMAPIASEVEEEFEVLPGVRVAPWDAARWISGESPLPDDVAEGDVLRWAWELLEMYRMHDQAVERIELAQRLSDRAVDNLVHVRDRGPDLEELDEVDEANKRVRRAAVEMNNARAELRVLRRAIVERKGARLPRLPPLAQRALGDQDEERRTDA